MNGKRVYGLHAMHVNFLTGKSRLLAYVASCRVSCVCVCVCVDMYAVRVFSLPGIENQVGPRIRREGGVGLR